MHPLLALPVPREFLLWPLTVLTRQARQARHAITVYFIRCLWFQQTLKKCKQFIVLLKSPITRNAIFQHL